MLVDGWEGIKEVVKEEAGRGGSLLVLSGKGNSGGGEMRKPESSRVTCSCLNHNTM